MSAHDKTPESPADPPRSLAVMPYSVVAAFEFDQCHAAPQRIEVREGAKGCVSIVLTGEKEMHLFGATLDQWGTWYDANEVTCVAQEWGTRSFIGALIGALEKFRERSEGETLPPTILPHNSLLSHPGITSRPS